MSKVYLYLSLMPEALVASMLPPEEFGKYLAIGTQKRSCGDAMYFSLKEDFKSDYFDLSSIKEQCAPHDDGSPKHTIYISIYRVLEHIPISALTTLHLTTKDGRVLTLEKGDMPTDFNDKHYLYDEICPLYPLIASVLNPVDFCKFITKPDTPISVPRICFTQLDPEPILQEERLGINPLRHLPARIKECLNELEETDKRTKTVDRTRHLACGWQNIKNGYYVGDQNKIAYYPFPSKDELDSKHHNWWRSACM